MVRFMEQRKSLFHFLTQVCAIVGGVFTVAGIFDRVIYSGFKRFEAKLEIGKLS